MFTDGQGFAVEAWIQPDTTTLEGSDYCPLLTFGSNESDAGSDDYNLIIEQSGTNLRVSTQYDGTPEQRTASSVLDDTAHTTQVCVG